MEVILVERHYTYVVTKLKSVDFILHILSEALLFIRLFYIINSLLNSTVCSFLNYLNTS
jgi:hypothetical protein